MTGIERTERRFRRPVSFLSRSLLFWKLQIAGWAVFLIVSIPLKQFVFDDVSETVAFMIYRDGPAFLLTLLLRYIYAAIYSTQPAHNLLAAVVFGFSLAGGLVLTFWTTVVYQVLGLPGLEVLDRLSTYRILYLCTSILLCWSLLYFGIRLLLDSADSELRVAQAETRWRESELQMLRAQMNPHFLFNALTAIRSEIGQQAPSLKSLIQALADYLRFSLQHANDSLIPIGEEFDAMEDYLTVEKARYGDGFEFECSIDESLRDHPVPGVLLQPLVENAIKYGRRTSAHPLRVQLTITSPEPEILEVNVSNTGTWIEPNGDSDSTNLGHQNLRSRLALLYPNAHQLSVAADHLEVSVKVQIPITR